jgi:hypothetical protein
MEWRYRVLKRDTNIVHSAIYNWWFYMCHTNYKIEKNQVWLRSNLISCAMNRCLFCCLWISWLKVLGMCEEKETSMVLGVPFRCLNEFRSSQVVSLWSVCLKPAQSAMTLGFIRMWIRSCCFTVVISYYYSWKICMLFVLIGPLSIQRIPYSTCHSTTDDFTATDMKDIHY